MNLGKQCVNKRGLKNLLKTSLELKIKMTEELNRKMQIRDNYAEETDLEEV